MFDYIWLCVNNLHKEIVKSKVPNLYLVRNLSQMKSVLLSKLVKFSRAQNEQKQTRANDLQKESSGGGGGDYWVICTAAAGHAFWDNDKSILGEKIIEFIPKREAHPHKPTKDKFQANIDFLHVMQDYDFAAIRPEGTIYKHGGNKHVIQIEDLPVKVSPQNIFTFGDKGNLQMGAIWFVTRVRGGYTDEELGMHTSAIFESISLRFGDKYAINPDYCIAVDVSRGSEVRHTQVLKGEVKDILRPTLNELKRYL